MRIRSIKPEYWRSEDISALNVEDRLLFIGLWSYVDDNGVGIDRLATVAADLFAGDIERDAPETFARVSRGLQNLSEAGLIVRYEAEGKRFLHVINWGRHQRIDKPNKPRYPLPTSGNEGVAESSRECRESPAPGTEEQRNRGTEEQRKKKPSTAARSTYPDHFEDWWRIYHGEMKDKAGTKKKAYTAYEKAERDKSPEELRSLLLFYFTQKRRQKATEGFTSTPPHAERWLRDERWNDFGEPVTITRNDAGQSIPQLSKDECDEILGGKDYWSCPKPPEGLDLMAEREWKRARVAEHLNERRQKAWEVMNRDAA